MARVTVEDCLKYIPNRFELVMVASKRARQLEMEGEEPTVPWEHDKATVVALREIAQGTENTMLLEEETDHFSTAPDLTHLREPAGTGDAGEGA